MGNKTPLGLVILILALCTSGVVAPLPSLSDIFGLSEETTPEPIETDKNAEAGGAAAGSLAFDKKVHLGDPKIASLDANLDLAAAKSAAFDKEINIEKGPHPETTPAPQIIILSPVRPGPPPPGPVVYVPSYGPKPPPLYYRKQPGPHYIVNNHHNQQFQRPINY